MWTTTDATQVTLSVDNVELNTYGPNDSPTVEFTCDGNSHVYTIVAQANGRNGDTRRLTINPA
jgi:hypothetical protein